MKAFDNEMKLQKERARNARGESNYMGSEESVTNSIPAEYTTKFVGYEFTEYDSKATILIKDNQLVDRLESGDTGIILTEETPFYAEMGGQIGDKGILYNDNFKAIVEDCQKSSDGKTLHIVSVVEGTLNKGDSVTLEVDKLRRNKIRKNHTSTHILHAALKAVLGDHVHQSGSLVEEDKLRFDFTHFTAMTEEEIAKVEELVNSNVMEAEPVITEVVSRRC